MAIVKMKHLDLVALKEHRHEMLLGLQRLGCVQICDFCSDEAPSLLSQLERPNDDTLQQENTIHNEVQQALSVLKQYQPEKKKFLAPRGEISEAKLFHDATAKKARKAAIVINSAQRSVLAIEAQSAKVQGQLQSLLPWKDCEIAVDTTGTQDMVAEFGTVPAARELAALFAQAELITPLVSFSHVSSDPQQHYLVLYVHRSAYEQMVQTLRDFGWSRVNLHGWTGTAAENIHMLEDELFDLANQRENEVQVILAREKHRPILKQLFDSTAQHIAHQKARAMALDTQETFCLSGWVPEKDEEKVAQLLGQFCCAWQFRVPREEEYPIVPVALENNAFTAPMNMITEMYSLPAYTGTDPNPLMAPFFVLFFGMMMADMGYGLLMILASILVIKKAKPKKGGAMDQMFRLAGICGVPTFLFGLVTGGFFGDFIPQAAKIINPASTLELPSLFTPVNDTLPILVGALALGVVQIITGMAIGFVRKIKKGQILDAVFEEVTWWIILAGLPLAILNITPVVLILGGILLLAGSVYKGKKDTFLGTLGGTFISLGGSLYNNVTGYFQDILSYSRLMALMLSGAVVAQVFNTLGAIPNNIFIFVLISMVGNMLNFALNILGCYVHDMRLQCLEFFNRFYEDGGKPFRPLQYDTQFYEIKNVK